MAISQRNNPLLSSSILSRIQTLISVLQRPKHTFAGEGQNRLSDGETSLHSVNSKGCLDISDWKTLDSSAVGISRSKISLPAWVVLKALHGKGFEAYLVGGCVRDLILKRTPKDFDVITTANLKQIRKQFRRCQIVGRRFPICVVKIQGSEVEVSSFETTAKNVETKGTVVSHQKSTTCNDKDSLLSKNSMQRDFTINSLFYDPFMNIVYDYAGGIKDLRLHKVRSIVPAEVAFKEDCARILRGIRIAARLGWQFSKETAAAIWNLSSSIMTLDKSRLMMELNFMLSYGAAESSIRLLQRFKLLEIVLPIQGAYLAGRAAGRGELAQSSTMLMKLFSSVDKLLSCDRPSDCSLWVGLLAFHLALLHHPQDALVVWTFSCILYYGRWNNAVVIARENAKMRVQFIPEISETPGNKSDESLLEDVYHLASLTKSSIHALTSTETLLKTMERYPSSPSSGLVFVSKKMGTTVSELFDIPETDNDMNTLERKSFDINYVRLAKGDTSETRFVLGKVIMDAMSNGIVGEPKKEAVRVNYSRPLSNLFI